MARKQVQMLADYLITKHGLAGALELCAERRKQAAARAEEESDTLRHEIATQIGLVYDEVADEIAEALARAVSQ